MIIDASVALKWLVPEEGSDSARALLTRVDLVGPTLLHIEVANGLRKKARRGELASTPDLSALIESVAGFVQTVDETPLLARALSLALRFDHAVYDCVYLAMAEQIDGELVTADLNFLRKLERSDMARMVVSL